MNNNKLNSIKIVNYSLILLIIIDYSIITYNIIKDKLIDKQSIYSEILGFITLLLLLYNYYNIFYMKEIFILLVIFITVRTFIFTYIISNYEIENYFSSNNIKAIAE